MRNLIIIGAGGFGREVAWTVEEMNRHFSDVDRMKIAGFADDNKSLTGRVVDGYAVLGTLDELPNPENFWFHCAIGNNKSRRSLAERCLALGMTPAAVVHPSALIAPNVEVGPGGYIGAYSILNPSVSVGRFVLINQRVAVGHGSVLEDYSQANPGAQINGACHLQAGALIGSNASLHPGVSIGENAIVGSNSQVLRNVAPRTTVNGVPARTQLPR